MWWNPSLRKVPHRKAHLGWRITMQMLLLHQMVAMLMARHLWSKVTLVEDRFARHPAVGWKNRLGSHRYRHRAACTPSNVYPTHQPRTLPRSQGRSSSNRRRHTNLRSLRWWRRALSTIGRNRGTTRVRKILISQQLLRVAKGLLYSNPRSQNRGSQNPTN